MLVEAAGSVGRMKGANYLAAQHARLTGRRGMARGAVVVVLSDGWAQDDPDDVAEAMRRLRRLAYRIVWVNPRRAAPGYAPLVGGMAAALLLTVVRADGTFDEVAIPVTVANAAPE